MLSAETFRKIYANIFNKIANDEERKKRNKKVARRVREGKKMNSLLINAQKGRRKISPAVDYNVHPAEAMRVQHKVADD